MKEAFENILAVAVLVAIGANIIVSWRTGDWAFVPTVQRNAKRLFVAWSLIVLVLACAFLFRWIDSFWFIFIAVSGQIVMHVWLAGLKLLKKDESNR